MSTQGPSMEVLETALARIHQDGKKIRVTHYSNYLGKLAEIACSRMNAENAVHALKSLVQTKCMVNNHLLSKFPFSEAHVFQGNPPSLC